MFENFDVFLLAYLVNWCFYDLVIVFFGVLKIARLGACVI